LFLMSEVSLYTSAPFDRSSTWREFWNFAVNSLTQDASKKRWYLGARKRWEGEKLLYRNVQRFRGGLVFKTHRLLYHSTPGLRVINKKRRVTLAPANDGRAGVAILSSLVTVERRFGGDQHLYMRQSRPDSGIYETVKARFWHI